MYHAMADRPQGKGQTVDLIFHLPLELRGAQREDLELQARRTGIQNKDHIHTSGPTSQILSSRPTRIARTKPASRASIAPERGGIGRMHHQRGAWGRSLAASINM